MLGAMGMAAKEEAIMAPQRVMSVAWTGSMRNWEGFEAAIFWKVLTLLGKICDVGSSEGRTGSFRAEIQWYEFRHEVVRRKHEL